MPSDDPLGRAERSAARLSAVLTARDDAIRDARAAGHSLGEIAAVTGLSRAGVAKIAAR